MTGQGKDVFELARKTRGMAEELDDSYIEKWIPDHILSRLLTMGDSCEMDDEGFWWGPSYVMATKVKLTGETVVVIATKPFGMGHHESKAVDRQGNIRVYQGNHLM